MAHNGDIEASFTAPILASDFDDIKNKSEKIQAITQKIANEFETMISKSPTQWHVLKSEWQKDD